MMAFVQRKAVAKLDWKGKEEEVGERESEEAGEDFMQARLRFTLHGLRFIETIDVSNVPTASTNIHRGCGTRRQIFSGNHFGFQPTGFWIRERLTLKFSTICSSLFLIRKSGFSIACSRNCSSGFILSLYYHILLRGEEKEEEIVEINGSICVRFDTCQPQGSCGLSRNCSGLNWGLWDGLLTSHWGTGCCR